jgi:hypothetical protein
MRMGLFWHVVDCVVCFAAFLAILDYFGIRLDHPAGGLPISRNRKWKMGVMLCLVAAGLGMSIHAFYRSFRPKIIEKVVEKPVEHAIVRTVSIPCPVTKKPRCESRPDIRLPNTGADSPPVETVIQGNGSAFSNNQQGGITAGSVNLTNRPDPKFEWSAKHDALDKVTVDISFEGPMDFPGFLATCDRPCESVSAGTNGVSQPTFFSGQGHAEVAAIGFFIPTTITYGDEIHWIIQSLDRGPISIVNVIRCPPNKLVPSSNGTLYRPSH